MATITLSNGTVFDGTVEEIGQFLLLSQQPTGPAAAKPQTSTTTKAKTTRSAKPKREVKVSAAQHAKGRHIEIAFGVSAEGKLSAAQQQRARQVFAAGIVEPWNVLSFPKGTITMAMIRQAVIDCNAALRGANETTITAWAVWNGPKGRLSDHEAREFMAKQRRSR